MYHEINPEKLREECGVLGIYTDACEETAKLLYYGLYALQHRGQESAGIAVNNGLRSNYHKAMGLVPDVFGDEILSKLVGHIGVGHVRYSSAGESHVENAQPLVARYRRGSLSLAHNGRLTNANIIKDSLEEDGVVFQTSTDSEVIMNLIARYNSGGDGIITAIERTMDLIKGAYALVIMTEKELIGIRDPLGFRPLCLGKMGDGSYVLSSESCALDVMGAKLVRDIDPGEIIVINKEGINSRYCNRTVRRASCIFEYVYFARPDSIIDGVSIYATRKNTGKILAEEYPVEADMVIAVPDSSVPAAIGYSEASGIPFGEGLIKNRYIGRTFIQPGQSGRELAVRLKLNPLKETIEGKRIVLIDDSVVRGTTIRKLVRRLKDNGAKEVHVRIGSPSVSYSCYFGINTPNRNRLIGALKTVEEIRTMIRADSLGYISMEGLIRATTLAKEHFCTACFSGDYPIDVPAGGEQKVFERLGGGE